MTFDLEILTSEKELFSGKADFLAAKALDGEIGILAGHAPLITVLGRGALRVTLPDGQKKEFQTEQGLLEAVANRVTALL
jgi:F-type H+-transporting ATPase subunit epsilon